MVAYNIQFGQGITFGEGIKLNAARITTTGAMSYSSGASLQTFRTLNRGGNWDEFFASWTNGTWSCDQFPGSVVVNMTNPGDDSPIVTITGGTFVLNDFYSFTGMF